MICPGCYQNEMASGQTVCPACWTKAYAKNEYRAGGMNDVKKTDEVFIDTSNKMQAMAERMPTLRDQFAMAALQGLLAGEDYSSVSGVTSDAYVIADDMLKAREKGGAK